jgi:hypothetical protein
MPSIFPLSPELNQEFTSEGTTWIWNGEAWKIPDLNAFDTYLYGFIYDKEEARLKYDKIKIDKDGVINIEDKKYVQWFTSQGELEFTWYNENKSNLLLGVK